jgi:hypothetical protein
MHEAAEAEVAATAVGDLSVPDVGELPGGVREVVKLEEAAIGVEVLQMFPGGVREVDPVAPPPVEVRPPAFARGGVLGRPPIGTAAPAVRSAWWVVVV